MKLVNKVNYNFLYFTGTLFFGIQIISYLKTIGVSINLTLVVTAMWLIGIFFLEKKIDIIKLTFEDLCVLTYAISVLIAFSININYLANSNLNSLLGSTSALLLCPFAYCLARNLNYASNLVVIKGMVGFCIVASLVFTALRVTLPEMVTEDASIYGSQYQYSGDSLAILVLLLYSIDGARNMRFMLPLSFLAIALTGSRASFLSFAFAIAFTKIGMRLILVFIALMIIYFIYYDFNLDIIMASLDFSRTFVTLINYFTSDIDQDSLQSRSAFTNTAINIIRDNIIFGNMDYSNSNEGPGSYAHNILHLWAAYGIFSILSIVALLVFLFRRSILMFSSPSHREYFGARESIIVYQFSTMPLLFFLSALIFFFRAPDNFIIFFALGAAVKIGLEANFRFNT